MVHCSGGGQTKILHFANQVKIIKDNLFECPPLFAMIQEQSGSEWQEMYKVFNMGCLLELYVPEASAQGILDFVKQQGIDARITGRVEAAAEKSLEIHSEKGSFFYT